MNIRLRLVVLLFSCRAISPAAVHVISSSGFTFSPPNVTINLGDTVRYSIISMHNAVQVSQATWNANDTTSNGGFRVPFGGGDIVPSAIGTYYYVCQAHASLGMKGILTVDPPAPAPDSLVVSSIVDRDGNISTTSDRIGKSWGLTIYRDSVGSGIVVGSVASGFSLAVDTLSPGTYVAVQNDSTAWSNVGVSVDGSDQASNSNQKSFTFGASGEKHAIAFLNFAPNTIISSGFSFVPDSISVFLGDTVHFVLDVMHIPREVSQSTWLVNDTVSNGGFDLPPGGGDAVLSQPGTHYYVCVPHVSIGMKGRIVVSDSLPKRISVAAGWNMLSLPLITGTPKKSLIYPTAISDAFEYQGAYISRSDLAVGTGYWLKFSAGQTVAIVGQGISEDTVKVGRGWNMIGSITTSILSSSIVSIPPGIIHSSYFGYNGSYFKADTITPGYGYWVNVSDSGKLVLASGAGNAFRMNQTDFSPLSEAGQLIFRDAASNSGTLYIIGNNEHSNTHQFFALPPPPPEGAFDVRFSSGDAAHSIDEDNGDGFRFEMRSAVYPVSISWIGKSIDRRILLSVDRKLIDLTGGYSVRIPAPVNSLILKIGASETLLNDYHLSEAFPNPFNPSTIVRYFLPTESNVTIRVYNVLGQEVAVLRNGQPEQRGFGSAVWNAERNGSGVYFIRMDALSMVNADRSFSHVVKVMFQK